MDIVALSQKQLSEYCIESFFNKPSRKKDSIQYSDKFIVVLNLIKWCLENFILFHNK